jgi:hypothetical protein
MTIQSSIHRQSWIPLHAIAVHPTTGRETVLSEGPAVEAIIAACSIPYPLRGSRGQTPAWTATSPAETASANRWWSSSF